MERATINVPRFLMRVTSCAWQIDWRGQSTGAGLNGVEQVLYNAMPRWTGSAQLNLRGDMGRIWRALIAQGQGRINAYSVPMVDPIAQQMETRADYWRSSVQDYLSGYYVEPKPVVSCVSDTPRGATSITVDERAASRPIRVGAILSANDWPFVVTARSGSGSATVLSIAMPLREAIAAGDEIDLAARGRFIATSDGMGWPAFDGTAMQSPTLDLVEWITRP